MIEVVQVEAAIVEANQRLAKAMAEVRKEREQGLEADWTAVAEQLETARDLAAEATAKAWIILGEAMTGPASSAPAFDETRGAWRVTATCGPSENVTFYRDGKLYMSYTYPAYKIWNVLAHLDEIIADLESTDG
jgi:hypothetical protein